MKAQVGKGSSIFMDVWFDTPGGLTMGANSTINQKCRFDTCGRLFIDKNVAISI
jgi:hypothetical protein